MIVKIYDTTEQLRTTAEVYDFRHLHEINKLDVLTGYILEPIEKGERILYKHKTGKWYEFVVDEPDIVHDDTMKYYFTAIDSLIEIDGDWIEDKRPTTLSNAVIAILEPTRWTLGVVTSKPDKLLTFYRKTAREAMDDVLKAYPVEFQTRITVGTNGVVTRTLDVLDRIGGDYGKRYVYDKDITSVKRTYRQGKIVTALYGYGKGEEVGEGYGRRIDFADINGGLAYVFDPAVLAQYGRMNGGSKVHVFDYVVFDDVTDKTELLLLTQIEYLKRSVPQVSYEASAIDLGLAHEQVGIGDTVKVIDGEHRYETRINYLLEEESGDQVRLATYIRSITDSNNELMDKVGDLSSHAGVWDLSQKFVDGSYLNGLIDALNDQANASGGWTFIEDGEGILTIDAPTETEATKAVNIVGGTVRVASFKNPDGTWKWRTFITGEVIAADMITAGILKGGKVHWNLETGVFYIGDSPATANLRWDGSNLYINGEDIDLSSNSAITERVTTGQMESALNLTATNLTAKFSQIGGRNLIKNSNFANGEYNWDGIDGGTKEDGDLKYITIVGNFDVSQAIHTDEGQTYTISALVRKSTSANSRFRVKFDIDNADTLEVAVNNSEWKRISTTRVATTTGSQLLFFHTRNTFPIDMTELQIEKGQVATDWSPHPSELTGATYSFDGDKFKIGGTSGDFVEHTNSLSKYTHSDGSYTQIGVNGMERFVSGTGQKYHYLVHAMTFIQGASGTVRWLQLPDEFKGKQFSIYLAIADTISAESTRNAIQRIVATKDPANSIDYVNARVPVIAYKTVVDMVSPFTSLINTVQGMLLAIY